MSMEKNRIRPIAGTKVMRMSYSRQEEVLEMPNLIEVQKDSYQWFLDEGLKEVFDDISPIADYSGALSLEFVDFELCRDDVKYSIEECKERDATFAAPLKVKVRLYNKEKEEISEHEIFMGDLPLMTETGTFVINGAERVIVSQLVRSPGIYYGIGHDKIGKKLFSCTVIPNRGAWLEYETDSNDVFYVRVDRTRKVPITVLIRALGIGTNDEIRELFGDEPKIEASFTKDTAENYQEGLLELYKKIRPGEPLSVESAESLINAMFFDPRRYDLAKVGRYKFNKKLSFTNRIVGFALAEDAVSPETGEVVAEAGTMVSEELAREIQNAAIQFVMMQTEEGHVVKVLSNMMVDLHAFLPQADKKALGITEDVYYPELKKILEENNFDFSQELLILYVTGDSLREQTATLFQRDMEEIGVKVNAQSVDLSTMIQMMRDKEADFAIMKTSSDGANPLENQDFFTIGGVYNLAHVTDPTGQELYSKIATALTEEEEKKYASELQLWQADASCYYFLYAPDITVIYNNRLSNMNTSDMSSSLFDYWNWKVK